MAPDMTVEILRRLHELESLRLDLEDDYRAGDIGLKAHERLLRQIEVIRERLEAMTQ